MFVQALAVCFPSDWSPRSKLGLSLASIHLPRVPFFQEKLQASMNRYGYLFFLFQHKNNRKNICYFRYFLKLKEENPVKRLNWTCMFYCSNISLYIFILSMYICYLVQIGDELCEDIPDHPMNR